MVITKYSPDFMDGDAAMDFEGGEGTNTSEVVMMLEGDC